MAWLYLILAGIFEIAWAILLKKNPGFNNYLITTLTITFTLASFYFLSLAMKILPLGTSYTVWTGIGALGTVIFGIIWLNEPKDLMRLGCIFLILIGIIGLKITS